MQSIVLFVHIVGVLGLFVGLGLEWISLDAIRRATTRDEAVRWARVFGTVPRAAGATSAVILLSGFYLGARFGVLGNAWMRASYVALVVMAVLAGPVSRPRAIALRRAVGNPGDRTLESVRAAAFDSILSLSLRLRGAFALAVVYLMVRKPEPVEATLALAAAAVAGVSTSRPDKSGGRVTREKSGDTRREIYPTA